MAKRIDWRRVKVNRSYTYEQAAQILSVHKNTIKRWVKVEGLQALTDQKPHLVLGRDLRPFLRRRTERRRRKLGDGEMYCFSCKAPRAPAGGMVEDVSMGLGAANLQAICPECERLMHRRVKRSATAKFTQSAEKAASEADIKGSGFKLLHLSDHPKRKAHG